MSYTIDFRDSYGNSFNSLGENFDREVDALIELYRYYKDGYDSETITGIAVEDNNGNDEYLIILEDEDSDWTFDTGNESTLLELLKQEYDYLKSKSQCMTLDYDEEDTLNTLEYLIYD